MADESKKDKMEALAQEVLILSRNTLLANLRFLDMALSEFVYHPMDESTLLTDGKYLIYHPKHILKGFKQQKEIPVRDYLHVVFHCVYRHMFMNPAIDRTLWDLACDIAVENVICELGLSSTAAWRQDKQLSLLEDIKGKVPMITAEKIYSYLKNAEYPEAEAAKLRALFYADNHEIWYMTDEQKQEQFGIGKSSDGDAEGSNGQSKMSRAELADRWKEISERMQVDAESFGQRQGNVSGSLTQNLKEVNRERYDYTAFLKKFAVLGETMKINDDEFDYIFYTYGMQLYDRMPLIEPLEYKEVKRIKEFVIAIDTSGSVSGPLVQKFVQKTYNILKSSESFFEKINLHIIQCDTEIKSHVKITSQEEFDHYLQNMKLHGFGGTDFRPVFSFVDELIAQGEFSNLKGMIYFTDGYGTFPKRKPEYDAAFVFVDDDGNVEDVPPWAIKLVLRSEEIDDGNV